MNNFKHVIILEPWVTRRPGLYADIPVPVLQVPATCHFPFYPFCQNSITTVARTIQESPACLNTCWWSMEPAVPQKYIKTYTWPSWFNNISLVICYIAFKTRISFKKHMKRGAYLLAPGPAGVKGRFVREIRLLLDGITVGGQITREREGSPL